MSAAATQAWDAMTAQSLPQAPPLTPICPGHQPFRRCFAAKRQAAKAGSATCEYKRHVACLATPAPVQLPVPGRVRGAPRRCRCGAAPRVGVSSTRRSQRSPRSRPCVRHAPGPLWFLGERRGHGNPRGGGARGVRGDSRENTACGQGTLVYDGDWSNAANVPRNGERGGSQGALPPPAFAWCLLLSAGDQAYTSANQGRDLRSAFVWFHGRFRRNVCRNAYPSWNEGVLSTEPKWQTGGQHRSRATGVQLDDAASLQPEGSEVTRTTVATQIHTVTYLFNAS